MCIHSTAYQRPASRLRHSPSVHARAQLLSHRLSPGPRNALDEQDTLPPAARLDNPLRVTWDVEDTSRQNPKKRSARGTLPAS